MSLHVKFRFSVVKTCCSVTNFISGGHLTHTHLSRIKSVYNFLHRGQSHMYQFCFDCGKQGAENGVEGIQQGLINHWQITAKATSIPIKAGQMQNCNWTTSSFKPTVGLPSYLSKSLLVSSLTARLYTSQQTELTEASAMKKCLCPQLWCCQPSGIYCKSHLLLQDLVAYPLWALFTASIYYLDVSLSP